MHVSTSCLHFEGRGEEARHAELEALPKEGLVLIRQAAPAVAPALVLHANVSSVESRNSS